VVATGDMLTSVFGGFATFAIVGYMATELRLPIDNVATHGNHRRSQGVQWVHLHPRAEKK